MYIADAMRLARTVTLGASALLATTLASEAASFSLSGGTSQQLLSSFNPAGWDQTVNDNIGAGTLISVFSSANPAGGLSVIGPAALTFTFLGTEAGGNNTLSFDGSEVFMNHSAAYGDTSGLLSAASGLLSILLGNGAGQTASNGVAIDSNVMLGILKVSASVAYIFFEDLVKGGDGDFDDMVMRVDIHNPDNAPGETPLPGAVWLFGSAIAGASGIGAWRRRRAINTA
jgi:hypothetical protein